MINIYNSTSALRTSKCRATIFLVLRINLYLNDIFQLSSAHSWFPRDHVTALDEASAQHSAHVLLYTSHKNGYRVKTLRAIERDIYTV